MNTETEVISPIETALKQANVTNKIISELEAEYGSLSIKGIDDITGFEKAKEGKKKAQKLRVLAVNICSAGRQEAIKIQKEWIAKEKEVVSKISQVEDYLSSKIDAVIAEQERVLFIAAQTAKLPERKAKLLTVDVTIEDSQLIAIDDKQFDALFMEFQMKYLEEKQRQIDEQAKRLAILEEENRKKLLKEEQARLAKEKAEADQREKERLALIKKQQDEEKAALKLIAEQEMTARLAAEKTAKEAKEREDRLLAEKQKEIDAEKKASEEKVAALASTKGKNLVK